MLKITNLAILLLLSLSVWGQQKGDNVITIVDFTKNSSFSQIQHTLLLNGYEISQLDTINNHFSTEFHPIEGSIHAYNLNVKILGILHKNNLVLTALYKSQYNDLSGGTADASGRASYERRKLIAKRLAFDELQRISLKLSSELSYSQE